jgi:hypothetical protein
LGLGQGGGGFLGHLGMVRRGGRCGIVLNGHRLAAPSLGGLGRCTGKGQGRDCRCVCSRARRPGAKGCVARVTGGAGGTLEALFRL